MRTFLILIALFFSFASNGQIPYFNLQFDNQLGADRDGFKTLVETDSFYISAGGSRPWPTGCTPGVILFVNKYTGNYSFEKSTISNGAFIISMIQDDESTITFLRTNYQCSIGNDSSVQFDFGKIKNNIVQNLNSPAFGLPGYHDQVADLIKTSDGGYATTGWSFPPTGQGSLLIFKCDSNFNQIFYRLVSPNPYSYFGGSTIETPDYGLIVVGNHRADNNNKDNALIYKVNSLGNTVFHKEITPIGDETRLTLGDIIRKPDGTYLSVGYKRIDPPLWKANGVGWRVGLNESGEVLWSKQDLDDESDDRGYTRIKKSPDGNYLLSGFDRKFPYTQDYPQFGTISKMTPDGDILWRRRYTVEEPNAHFDIFQDVIATTDGGILVVGNTYANDSDSTHQNIWMMKLDSLGCDKPGCDTITSVIVLPVGKNNPLKIYPNPTNGIFSIETEENDLMEMVRVFDINGKLIIDQKVNKTNKIELDISMHPSGQYFVSIQIDNKIVSRSITKI